MLHFHFSEKGLGIASHHILRLTFQEISFLGYILLTDQISLPDYLYFFRYLSISVLQLFVTQVVTT